MATSTEREKLLDVTRLLFAVALSSPDMARVFTSYVNTVEHVFRAEEIPHRREMTMYGFARLVVDDERTLDSTRGLFYLIVRSGGIDAPPPIPDCTRDEFVLALSILLVGSPESTPAVPCPGGSA